ncbi:M23 family metallopeptidase [Polymorphobacter arshaanensis]|uniref:M23 family metallopeptidase n=1 Tax=Glacieibacterium arshaanense TaxID=2511025 RepID=A0A4Y9EQB9_9SPHN|nr:M23 family metallopeptidase [Polymorphobacter arshaanensis]TFU03559.1 M23 family metallopeptidase [Polymorphobacter arshaanensis]
MGRNLFATVFAASLAIAAAPTHAVEIRLCEHEMRTAPLSDERGVQSMLLQRFAVVNTGNSPVTLTGVSFNLLDKQERRDSRWLAAADVARAAKQAPQVTMLAQIFPAQFCNGKMLAGTKLATTDTLAPGEAVVFMYQPFVWKGARDGLEIIAETRLGALAKTDRIVLPITTATSKTQALFPVAGRSFAAVGASFHTPHRWASIEEFAYDILMMTGNTTTYSGTGTKLADYAVFGKPVRAVADGKVVAAVGNGADNVAMLKRPGETDEAYMVRLQQGQMALLAKGMAAVLGNHVVIDHGNGEFSIYAHLKQGSVAVAPGAMVKAGESIGAVGSSGNSTEPHLHFQICDGPDIGSCQPIPISFIDYRLPFELAPRTIQSGDIVETVK